MSLDVLAAFFIFSCSINSEMEKIATVSHYQYYQYGKIRIWNTIDYALGFHLVGLICDYAIFVVFVITMCLAVVGTYFAFLFLKIILTIREYLIQCVCSRTNMWLTG
ncbi:MAG: hypothetical protein LUH02_12325 [Erysipelotrichaceae bacterium]|nr:hypothetical protein [Erysipelotrichaceae bacterium]